MPLLIDKDIKDKIIYDLQRGKYKYIGSGSSREVFDLSNGYVIKVAKNKAGIEQNKTEFKISNNDDFDIFADIIFAMSNYKYVVMEKAEKIKSINYVWRSLNVYSKNEFSKLSLIRNIKYKYNLLVSDLVKVTSWGIINGRLQIIDYGFTREVKDKYY